MCIFKIVSVLTFLKIVLLIVPIDYKNLQRKYVTCVFIKKNYENEFLLTSFVLFVPREVDKQRNRFERVSLLRY